MDCHNYTGKPGREIWQKICLFHILDTYLEIYEQIGYLYTTIHHQIVEIFHQTSIFDNVRKMVQYKLSYEKRHRKLFCEEDKDAIITQRGPLLGFAIALELKENTSQKTKFFKKYLQITSLLAYKNLCNGKFQKQTDLLYYLWFSYYHCKYCHGSYLGYVAHYTENQHRFHHPMGSNVPKSMNYTVHFSKSDQDKQKMLTFTKSEEDVCLAIQKKYFPNRHEANQTYSKIVKSLYSKSTTPVMFHNHILDLIEQAVYESEHPEEFSTYDATKSDLKLGDIAKVQIGKKLSQRERKKLNL